MTDLRIASAFAALLVLASCGSGDRPTVTAQATPHPDTEAQAPAPSTSAVTAVAPRTAAPEGTQKEVPMVVVNGRELSEAQLAAFKQQYGVLPAAGRWWYDAVSGMYGPEGQGAVGFMYAGHDFGPLAADASRGNTSVFINGRQLTMTEVNYLAWLAGGAVMPGRYWVDAQLNWGYEGTPYPAGNLRLLAASRGGGGGGGGRGGDNTWSGLVGAGNYNDDNSVGYVSIPGVGPIGSYGM